MNVKIRIMCRAVKTRMAQGEQLEDILNGYSKLSEAEKDEIRNTLTGK